MINKKYLLLEVFKYTKKWLIYNYSKSLYNKYFLRMALNFVKSVCQHFFISASVFFCFTFKIFKLIALKFFMYLLLVSLITESTSRWVTPFQHTSKVFQSFVLAGCINTREIIGVVKFISLFTLNFFVIEQYSNDHLDFVKRNCCTGIRVAYGG